MFVTEGDRERERDDYQIKMRWRSTRCLLLCTGAVRTDRPSSQLTINHSHKKPAPSV